MPQYYEPFSDVPAYNLSADYADPSIVHSKMFVIDRTMVYSAAVSAVMDGGETRELQLNAFDTTPSTVMMGPEPWQKAFARIFDDQGRTTWFDLPAMQVKGQPLDVGIIDIVTYPFLYGITRQIDAPKLLWQINHNILGPYLHGFTGWAGVWSVFHWNEQPIDDAPCHNLITFAPRLEPAIRKAEAERLFAKLPPAAIIPVTSKQRVMDSRCALLQRGPNDAPARPMDIMQAAEVVPQMLRAKASR